MPGTEKLPLPVHVPDLARLAPGNLRQARHAEVTHKTFFCLTARAPPLTQKFALFLWPVKQTLAAETKASSCTARGAPFLFRHPPRTSRSGLPSIRGSCGSRPALPGNRDPTLRNRPFPANPAPGRPNRAATEGQGSSTASLFCRLFRLALPPPSYGRGASFLLRIAHPAHPPAARAELRLASFGPRRWLRARPG